MTRRVALIVLCVAVATMLAGTGFLLTRRDSGERQGGKEMPAATAAPALRPDDAPARRPDRATLSERSQLAAEYLVKACAADGRFEYRVHLDREVISGQRYNELRHAGAMYALGMYDQWRPDPPAVDALVRAGHFLSECCIGPVEEWPDALAVWSEPTLTGDKGPREAKLGGSGLGLVALLSLEKVAPGTTSPEVLAALGRFLRHMQRPDGTFFSKYIPTAGGRYDRWVSLYYPGEAALGLVMLYEHDSDETWLLAAGNAITALARQREGETEVPADHWALLATARLLPHADTCTPPIPRDVLVSHAVQIVNSMLSEQIHQADDPAFIGGFVRDGRTTPTATRLEGLIAALDILPAEQAQLRQKVLAAIEPGVTQLLRSQVLEGEERGAIPRAIRQLPPSHPDHSASFNREAGEVRIDYVQHALCVFLEYDRLLARPGP